MDPLSSFTQRLKSTLPLLFVCFAAGFGIALWKPRPQLILTVALGISMGMLLLGPYAAAAMYPLRLQRFWRGHLRLPLCFILAISAVFILDYFLAWSFWEFVLACFTAILGTVLGHDAALAVLELIASPRGQLDHWMVVFFPIFIGLSVLAGYCSLGFGSGSYQLIVALFG